MITLKKKLKLIKSYLKSKFNPLPIWVHLWITERCNLDCKYCHVVDNISIDPSKEEVKSWISKADNLGAAAIAFMGGEPTIRKDMSELISFADKRNLITYLTSNGKLLTYENLLNLASSGLDILEISVDGYYTIQDSKKTLNGDETLIDILERVYYETGMRYKLHQVLTPSTLEETLNLLELCKKRKTPISFGLVDNLSLFNSNVDKLKEVLKLLIREKRNGTLILNPTQYFKYILKSLEAAAVKFDCDVGNYMIQVAIDGNIYSCSKLRIQTQRKFLDIDRSYFEEYQHKNLLVTCNNNCFSACSYTASFFRKKPLELILYNSKV